MPSTRTLLRGSALAALLALQGVAVAQAPETGSELGVGARLAIRFGVALVVNLLLGGALVAFGPRYATDSVRALQDDPGTAFGWGLLVGIVVPIVLAILAATIVGLVVAIPGALVLVAVGIVGNAVTIVWIGDSIAGSGGEVGASAVAVGALLLAGVLTVPVLGNLLTTIVGFFGLGVVSRGLYHGYGG